MTTAEINLKIKRLLSYKEIVKNNDTAIIGTHNKKTGWNGCASFLNEDGMIKVFEGNPDGSDDTSGKGLHLAMTGEPRGFSRFTAGFSSYDGEFRMPLVLAQASPIFHSSCEAKLGIALE